MGPAGLYPVQQVRHGLPACHDPRQGLRSEIPEGRSPDVQVDGLQGDGIQGDEVHRAGGTGRLHRVRSLRRSVPCEEQVGDKAEGDQHDLPAAAPRIRARQLRVLPQSPGDGPPRGEGRYGERLAVPPAALRVLGSLFGVRRDAVRQARDPALRRQDGGGQRDRVLIDIRRQPPDNAMVQEQRRARTGMVQLSVRRQRRVRSRDAACDRQT